MGERRRRAEFHRARRMLARAERVRMAPVPTAEAESGRATTGAERDDVAGSAAVSIETEGGTRWATWEIKQDE